MSAVKVFPGVITCPTYTRQPARVFPSVFNQGAGAIYPVPADDLLDGPKRPVDYAAIFLENEHLRLTILPDLGGKIWSVFDKNIQAEVLYVPDVIRPSLIAVNGAWIPGGIEYNFPVGHHAATMAPVPCAVVEQTPQRVAVLAEIIHPHSGLRLNAVVSLQAGAARFDIDYCAWNPTATAHRWGFWCNVGTFAHDDWQFFSKARLYHTGFLLNDYPVDASGLDTSWWKNRPVSSDSFMMGSLDNFFGYYDHRRGLGLAHVSADKSMLGMKYHTWGREYRNYWPEVCFTEDHRNYTEIQSGRHETQMDFGVLQPGQSDRFTETWIPYRGTGGLEWMNRDVLLKVRDGQACLYALVACQVTLKVNGRVTTRRLPAGQPVRLPLTIKDGDRIELTVNGACVYRGKFPYPGRNEHGARERIQARYGVKPVTSPRTAQEHLARARRQFEMDQLASAIHHYRAALKLAPRRAETAFELAGCLWRCGEWAEGARLLTRLSKTRLRGQALALLASRSRAELEFFGPALQAPAGVERDLARAERFAGYDNARRAEPLLAGVLRKDPANPRACMLMAALQTRARHRPEAAIRYLTPALKAHPGERELTLELAAANNAAGRFAATLALLERAPRAVRELAANQKLLAKALYQTGQDRRCHDLMRTRRLFNWEGETQHLDLYVDATLALCEAALKRGRCREALRYAQAAQTNPPTLGMEIKHMSHSRRQFWLGRALQACGRTDQATAAFRAGVDRMVQEKALRLGTSYGVVYGRWVTAEDAYMLCLCAEYSGDAERLTSARRFVTELLENHATYGYGPDPATVRALMLEFNRDFRAAAAQLKRLRHRQVEKRLLGMHLQAVTHHRRRGDA